jgi:hypothetical protein
MDGALGHLQPLGQLATGQPPMSLQQEKSGEQPARFQRAPRVTAELIRNHDILCLECTPNLLLKTRTDSEEISWN